MSGGVRASPKAVILRVFGGCRSARQGGGRGRLWLVTCDSIAGMVRPLSPLEPLASESHDSGSFGGLADVLEPDQDQDETPVSLRRVAPPSSRNSGYLQGSLPLSSAAPVSIRAPVQVEDFAFADTVFANELAKDLEAPPSGPIFFDDEGANTQCVTPLAFPLPDAAKDVDFSTRLRVMSAHTRHSLRRAVEEMRELWGSTADGVDGAGDAPGRRFVLVRRLLALWSCFQWSLTDLTRAAIIGSVVFLAAGAMGAAALDFSIDAGNGDEVRAPRTLDQHTGRRIVLHGKR